MRLFSFSEKNRETEASLVERSGFSKSICCRLCCRLFNHDGHGAGELRLHLAFKGERTISTMYRRQDKQAFLFTWCDGCCVAWVSFGIRQRPAECTEICSINVWFSNGIEKKYVLSLRGYDGVVSCFVYFIVIIVINGNGLDTTEY